MSAHCGSQSEILSRLETAIFECLRAPECVLTDENIRCIRRQRRVEYSLYILRILELLAKLS